MTTGFRTDRSDTERERWRVWKGEIEESSLILVRHTHTTTGLDLHPYADDDETLSNTTHSNDKKNPFLIQPRLLVGRWITVSERTSYIQSTRLTNPFFGSSSSSGNLISLGRIIRLRTVTVALLCSSSSFPCVQALFFFY